MTKQCNNRLCDSNSALCFSFWILKTPYFAGDLLSFSEKVKSNSINYSKWMQKQDITQSCFSTVFHLRHLETLSFRHQLFIKIERLISNCIRCINNFLSVWHEKKNHWYTAICTGKDSGGNKELKSRKSLIKFGVWATATCGLSAHLSHWPLSLWWVRIHYPATQDKSTIQVTAVFPQVYAITHLLTYLKGSMRNSFNDSQHCLETISVCVEWNVAKQVFKYIVGKK